ncbi:MAG: PTS sugar transporter subunit IIA [Planctomycetes bacterium]|nr:PTS sugar transporter subunit IIA [Planctomycetota bacterium]
MKIIDVLRKECVVAGARFLDKPEALCEIVQAAKKNPILKDVPDEEILAGLEERESLGSTGFGKGIAIPHCRLKSITDFVAGIITVPDGVDFEALDGEKVDLIIFIIAPEAKSNEHLKLLSAISQTLLIPGAVKEILAERTTEAVCESFLRHTRAEIDTRKQTTKCQFNVFVQDETVFRDILEKLAGIETSSLVVANTENVVAYLTKVPLFADFWRDKPSSFSKVIMAIGDKGLSNETIRRIESVTGDLNKCVGVVVTIHDICYAAGSL